MSLAAQESERSVAPRDSCPRHRALVLALLMGLCFISHFNRASITSAGDERIMQQFGISTQQMGGIYSAFLLFYTIFMIPGGWLIDRRGPRFAMGCVAFGSAVFCALTGLIGFSGFGATQVVLSMLIVRSLMGVFSAPLHPSAARAVGDSFSAASQARANGLITGASILAYALVHPVFGRLIDAFDWKVAFQITASATVLLGIAWIYFGPPPRLKPDAELSGTREKFFPAISSDLVLLTLSYAAVGYFQYLFFYWLHYYFDSVLGMDKTDSRYFAGLPNLAMAVCMPLGGVATDLALRWRKGDPSAHSIVPKIGMFLSALLLLCGIFAKERFWIVASFTASLGVLGLCEASFWTVAVNLGKQRGGTSAAIMNTGGNGIGLLAPLATPWLSEHLGWQWGFGAGAIVALLGAFCWFGIRSKHAEFPEIP